MEILSCPVLLLDFLVCHAAWAVAKWSRMGLKKKLGGITGIVGRPLEA